MERKRNGKVSNANRFVAPKRLKPLRTVQSREGAFAEALHLCLSSYDILL